MKTFDEWSKAGYKINKGSKGVKVGNNYYFTESQVTYSPRRSHNSTFAGCAPKGTSQLWGDLDEDNPDYYDNPILFDYVGRAY